MKRFTLWAIGVTALQALTMSICAQVPNGAALFKQSCNTCHSGEENSRAPSLDSLRSKSPEAIVDALVNGAMRLQGSRLSGAERRALPNSSLAGRWAEMLQERAPDVAQPKHPFLIPLKLRCGMAGGPKPQIPASKQLSRRVLPPGKCRIWN
jgi:hypothetical protein